MTNKGAKRNVPHLLQAQEAPVCDQYRNAPVTNVPRHLHLLHSRRVGWSPTVLWTSVSADFIPFQVGVGGGGGGEKEEERHGIDKKSKSK